MPRRDRRPEDLAWPRNELGPPADEWAHAERLATDRAGADAEHTPPPRVCEDTRRDGRPCQGRSLRFADRAVCGNHATRDERHFNHMAEAVWRDRLDLRRTASPYAP